MLARAFHAPEYAVGDEHPLRVFLLAIDADLVSGLRLEVSEASGGRHGRIRRLDQLTNTIEIEKTPDLRGEGSRSRFAEKERKTQDLRGEGSRWMDLVCREEKGEGEGTWHSEQGVSGAFGKEKEKEKEKEKKVRECPLRFLWGNESVFGMLQRSTVM